MTVEAEYLRFFAKLSCLVYFDVGRQIRDAVQGALASGDFKEMNQIVSASVTRALSEAKRQVSEAMAGISKEPAREESHSQEKTRTQTTVRIKCLRSKSRKWEALPVS